MFSNFHWINLIRYYTIQMFQSLQIHSKMFKENDYLVGKYSFFVFIELIICSPKCISHVQDFII
jgi:hypothetical protein